MSLAKISTLADAVASTISTAWNPSAPSAVTRLYGEDISLSPDIVETLVSGRQLFVLPVDFSQPEIVTRNEAKRRYTVGVIVVERDTSTGDNGIPSNAWMDTRIAFVEAVFNLVANPFSALGSAGNFQPDDSCEFETLYDRDLYLKYRTFFSVMVFNFIEIQTIPGNVSFAGIS